jgi:hypothetical protein
MAVLSLGFGVAALLFAFGCGGSSSDAAGTDGGSPSCTAGSYHCIAPTGEGTGYDICQGGSWVYAGSCTCMAGRYYSNCKYRSLGAIDCSYAGASCLTCEPGVGCH